jgi:hypothetical protein
VGASLVLHPRRNRWLTGCWWFSPPQRHGLKPLEFAQLTVGEAMDLRPTQSDRCIEVGNRGLWRNLRGTLEQGGGTEVVCGVLGTHTQKNDAEVIQDFRISWVFPADLLQSFCCLTKVSAARINQRAEPGVGRGLRR